MRSSIYRSDDGIGDNGRNCVGGATCRLVRYLPAALTDGRTDNAMVVAPAAAAVAAAAAGIGANDRGCMWTAAVR